MITVGRSGYQVQMLGELPDGSETQFLLIGIGRQFTPASFSALYSNRGCEAGAFERLGGGFNTRPREARLNLTTVLELMIDMVNVLVCVRFEPNMLQTWLFNGMPIRPLPFDGLQFTFEAENQVVRRH